MHIGEREKEILSIILKSKIITISKIAKDVQLSNKTVSESLKKIEKILENEDVSLVRKQNLGVYIEGDKEKVLKVLNQKNTSKIPNSKIERIQYLCFYVLTREEYFTQQELADLLFISKTTIEKDIQEVFRIFEHFNIRIEKINGKGSFVNLMEQEKRKLAIDLLYYFWGENWEIQEKNGSYFSNISGIPDFVTEFIDISIIGSISEVLQTFLLEEKISLTDISLQALILHISIAIDRLKDGHSLEIESIEEKELNQEWIQKLIRKLEETFDILIPNTEIQNIIIHFEMNNVDSKQSFQEPTNDSLISSMIQESIPLIDEKTLLGLVTHLEAAILRIKNGLSILNPFTNDVKNNFPISFDEAIIIKQKIDSAFNITTPEQEVAYIAVHIQAFKERQKEEYQQRISTLLVCSSGKGTAQLLAARLRRIFPEISVTRIISVQKLMSSEIEEDMIISTIPLTIEGRDVIKVSPILNDQEIKEIGLAINEQKVISRNFRNKEFSNLIQPEFIFIDEKMNSKEKVIEFIGDKLISEGYATREIISSAIEREELASTSFGNTATPHGSPKFVNQSVIVFLRLKEDILWGTNKVKYVFFICIKNESAEALEQIYDELLDIMEDTTKRIFRDGTKEELLMYMKEGI